MFNDISTEEHAYIRARDADEKARETHEKMKRLESSIYLKDFNLAEYLTNDKIKELIDFSIEERIAKRISEYDLDKTIDDIFKKEILEQISKKKVKEFLEKNNDCDIRSILSECIEDIVLNSEMALQIGLNYKRGGDKK